MKPLVCIIDGCDGVVKSRGYCMAHYLRLRRHGDPLGGGTGLGAPLQWLKDHVAHKGDDGVSEGAIYDIEHRRTWGWF